MPKSGRLTEEKPVMIFFREVNKLVFKLFIDFGIDNQQILLSRRIY